MKTRLLSILCALQMSLGILAHDLEPLHVDGRYLMNSKGDIVTLHGYMTVTDPGCQADEIRGSWDGYDVEMCIKNKKATLDAILKSGWKMDYVRLLLDAYWCTDQFVGDRIEYKTFNFGRFKKYFEEVYLPLINYYHEKGIYTLLYPPYSTPETIEVGDEFQQHMLLIWDYISNHPRIRNNPSVMFELVNEPVNLKSKQGEYYDAYWGFMFNISSAFREVRDYWQPIVDKIRSHCDNVIYVPGMLFESDHAGFADYPIEGENIGYAVHWYPGWWGNMRKDWEGHVFPIAYKAPIIITENAWAPYNNYLGGNSETSTSKFGKPLKDIVDELGNVSWNCYEPEEDYYYFVNSSSSSEKAVISNNPEACFKAMYQWWNDYSKTKVMPCNQLKAKAVSFDEFPTTVVSGQKSLAKIKAEFTNGMTWDVSGDVEYTIADKSVLSIKHGVIWALKEGSTTVTAKYIDGTGQTFSHEFDVTNTLFPLTKEGFVLDQFSLDAGGSFDETTGTFSSGSYGSGGWDFENGMDLSSYKYLVVQLNQEQHCWTTVHIADDENTWDDENQAWNDEINDIGFPFNDKTELVIDLHSLHNQKGEPIDLSHIYRVDIWINGAEGSVSIKRVFLSNDGITPAFREPIRVYADNKVMYYGDEVPDLTYSTSGPPINGKPKLSTTANSASFIGTYPITIEQGTVSNDQVTFIDGTLTIMKKPMYSTEYEPEGLGFETAAEAVKNMKIGWNLVNTLESFVQPEEAWSDFTSCEAWETAWGNPVTKPELLKMMRKAGFNTMRIPVTWFVHPDSQGNIDVEWMKRVHEVVDYVIDQGMYCILNTHHETANGDDHPAKLIADPDNYRENKEWFENVWKQIANEFKDYDQHLLFEGYNEMTDENGFFGFPYDKSDETDVQEVFQAINDYAQSFVNAVRSTGGNNRGRNLIVNTYSACVGPVEEGWCLRPYIELKIPNDVTENHIIFGIHCYGMDNESDARGVIKNVNNCFTSRGVPTIISEYGIDMNNFDIALSKQASENDIAPIIWNHDFCDGIFREYPIFNDTEKVKAALKAYYGDSYEPELMTIDDYDYQGISVSFDPQGTTHVVLGENLDLNVYKGIRIELDDNLDGLTLIAYANWEGKEQHFPISSASETYYFDQSILGDAIISIALWNNKNEKNKTRVINSYLIKHDGTERLVPLNRYNVWDSKIEIVMPRKQYVHIVKYEGLWTELNIFSDDIPLKLKNYKGIRLELAEIPEDGNFLIHIYGNEDKENDYQGLTGTSTTIMFNPEIFSKDINRVTLQYLKDGKTEAKVISAWLIRQDGTEEYSDLSPSWGCEITNVVKIGKSNGDVNGDWKLDVADIVAMENYINKKPTLKFNIEAADLNNDGKINQTDVNILVNMILSAQKQ